MIDDECQELMRAPSLFCRVISRIVLVLTIVALGALAIFA